MLAAGTVDDFIYSFFIFRSLSNRSGSRRGSAYHSLRQSMESLTVTTGDGSFLTTPPRFSTPKSSGLVPTKSTQASR